MKRMFISAAGVISHSVRAVSLGVPFLIACTSHAQVTPDPLEKTFMVYLVVANASHSYTQSFWIGAGMDAAVVLYTIVYFAVCGFNTPSS